jgi:hypothetical protein
MTFFETCNMICFAAVDLYLQLLIMKATEAQKTTDILGLFRIIL